MYLYTLDTCKMSIYGIIEYTLITIVVTVKTIGQLIFIILTKWIVL